MNKPARQRRHRHNSRDTDWALAALLFTFGAWLVLVDDAFAAPQFSGFLGRGVGEDAFGFVMIAVGAFWCAGLYINGSWERSPFLRLLCSMAGLALFFMVEGAFLMSPFSLYTAIFGCVLVFSFITCARCGADAATAARKIYKRRGRENADVEP